MGEDGCVGSAGGHLHHAVMDRANQCHTSVQGHQQLLRPCMLVGGQGERASSRDRLLTVTRRSAPGRQWSLVRR
jgi:hypothetical protein